MSELLAGLADIVTLNTHEEGKPENEWAQGSLQQRDRIEAVARCCAHLRRGDLVEIGCMNGSTTVRLAKVAREFGRRIIAVDPWQPGTQDCEGEEYDNFMQITKPYQDVLEVIRLPSQSNRAIAKIARRDLCFAFLDGLHTRKALLTDIRTVQGCAGIVAVDDISWRPEDLLRAFWEGAQETGRMVYYHPLCREGYLLPC